MRPTFRLVVESGPDRGAVFVVPETGCSVGRSSHNDVLLMDEKLSRLHCRFQFRQDELWVTDLASANGTEVDGVEIAEQRVQAGSRVRLGDTLLRVETEDAKDAPDDKAAVEGAVAAPVPVPGGESPAVPPASAAVDLGLSDTAVSVPEARHLRRTLRLAVAAFLGLLLLAGLIRWMLESPAGSADVNPLAPAAGARTLELRYEKVEGSAENLFRYELVLDAQGRLAVAVDDLVQSRHVRKESPAPVAAALLAGLGRQLEESGFFTLDPAYEGIAQPNSLASYDLTVVLGLEAHRVRVLNRTEPESFRAARERVETFARNELGLWAVEFSRERLEGMAHDAYRLGVRLLQEKDIQAGNLFAASRSFQECVHFLDTVEPKPAFLQEALAGLREAGEEMGRRYTEQNFRADRAIKLKDWEAAASELRSLLELVPDRTDDRYRDAERRLLDVEARLKQRSAR